MKLAILIIHIIVAVGLIGLILLQSSKGGLGGGLGGGEFYRSKRGIDRLLFVVTVVLSVLFIGTALAFIFVR